MKVPEPRRLKNGRWYIYLRVGGETVSITENTKKDCVYAAALKKSEILSKKAAPKVSASLTLTQAIDAYIAKRPKLSPSTVNGYRIIQRNRFQGVMNCRVDRITDWPAIIARETCSQKTLHNAWGFIKSVLRECGVPSDYKISPGKVKEREWLDDCQIKTLIESVSGQKAELPVLLALHSLRRSEIAALRYEDVNLNKGTITVQGAVVQDEHHRFVERDENKTIESTRVIPIMIPSLADAIRKTGKTNGKIFDCLPQTICERINAACKKAGVPEVGTHGLRHSFASLAVHVGLSEVETMEIGGWSDPQTMRKIYQHVSKADRLRAANKMAEFYAPKVEAREDNANQNVN